LPKSCAGLYASDPALTPSQHDLHPDRALFRRIFSVSAMTSIQQSIMIRPLILGDEGREAVAEVLRGAVRQRVNLHAGGECRHRCQTEAATLISQVLSGFLCLGYVLFRVPALTPSQHDLHPDRALFRRIFSVSAGPAFSSPS